MGVVDMSMPERWGVLQFADDKVGQTNKVALPFWRARAVAMAVHNAQQAFSRRGNFVILRPNYRLYGESL
jgi:hypothetical protein